MIRPRGEEPMTRPRSRSPAPSPLSSDLLRRFAVLAAIVILFLLWRLFG
jgi:hypothetical protein